MVASGEPTLNTHFVAVCTNNSGSTECIECSISGNEAYTNTCPALLTLLRGDRRVQAFAESELGRLIRHDARSGDDLMGVLRTYLQENGSKVDTARVLGCSRPTLYARLATIERVTGARLDDLSSLASLHAALLVVDTNAPRIHRG